MDEVCIVYISPQAEKDLSKVPDYIAYKLYAWVQDVEERGLSEVKKTPGYNDEPLKGKRKGQRSIRLNRCYRAIYTLKNSISENGQHLREILLTLLEVNKHDY